jgi:hypothetical protein
VTAYRRIVKKPIYLMSGCEDLLEGNVILTLVRTTSNALGDIKITANRVLDQIDLPA